MENQGKSFMAHFSILRDPRIERTKKHLLHYIKDIIVIAVSAVIGGALGWIDIEEFGIAREEWFQTFLELPHGIPSHDTFARVFSILDPVEFQRCFYTWIQAVQESLKGKTVAIDGKTLRRSFDTATGKSAIHMVSAWVVENQVVLGQVKVDDKSNEITAVPKLLKHLNLEGSTVTP